MTCRVHISPVWASLQPSQAAERQYGFNGVAVAPF